MIDTNDNPRLMKGRRVDVLEGGGFIEVIDLMGSDRDIIQHARETTGGALKSLPEDRRFLRYMFRHRHTSPFEFAEVIFRIQCPMDVWRQWIRHRTANVQEASTRHSEAGGAYITPQGMWRAQGESNRQGSGGLITEPAYMQDALSAAERELLQLSEITYRARLDAGVAREQARKDLPLSTWTRARWKCDLHNLLHFAGLRMADDAQAEIRAYANALGGILADMFPWTWEAFEDYRRHALTLSRHEIGALRFWLEGMGITMEDAVGYFDGDQDTRNLTMPGLAPGGEQREFLAKLGVLLAKE